MKNVSLITCLIIIFGSPAWSQDRYVDSLKSVESKQEGVQRIETMLVLAQYLAKRDDVEQMLVLQNCLAYSKSENDPASLRIVYQSIGIALKKQGLWLEARQNLVKAIYYRDIVMEKDHPNFIQDKDLLLSFYKEAYNLSKELAEVEQMAVSCLELSQFLYGNGNAELSSKYMGEAKADIQKVEAINPRLALNILKKNAQQLEHLGELAEAIVVQEQLISLCERNQFSNEMARAFSAIGILHEHSGDFEKALSYAQRALQIGGIIGDKEIMATANTNIGNVFSQTARKPLALEHYYIAIAQLKEASAEKGMYAAVFSNLSIIYSEREEFDSAIFFLNKTLEIDRAVNYEEGVIVDYSNLGNVYKLKGDYEKAKEFSFLAREKAKNLGLSFDQSMASYNLAEIFHSLGAHTKALVYAQESVDVIAGQSNLRMSYSYRLMSEIEEALQHPDKSLTYYKLHQIYYDSVYTIKAEEKVVNLEKRLIEESHEREINSFKKDQQIQKAELNERKIRERFYGATIFGILGIITLMVFLLRQKSKANKLLELKTEEIQAQKDLTDQALDEKKLLLKEIHHRVKNNLQTVSSLLSLQARYLNDENAIKALEESEGRLRSISLLHQKLYQNKTLAEVNFEEYVQDLVSKIEQTWQKPTKQISLHVIIDNLVCSIDFAMPLGLIINELITNSFKYAFKEMDAGEIEVKLQTQNQMDYELIIADNGSGFPVGFTLEKNESLGLNLVQLLVQQIKGDMHLNDEPNTEIRIKFNLQKIGK